MSHIQSSNFQVNEKVLCFSGPILKDAKCIEIKVSQATIKYKVHFVGSSKTFDEWVDEFRLRKINEENLNLKENLERQHIGEVKRKKLVGKSGRSEKSGSSKNVSNDVSKPNKILATVETKDEYMAKVTFKIELPKILNSILVDDWDLITRQRKLCKQPSNVTVVNILETYYEKRCSENVENTETFKEFTSGVQFYFDNLLSPQLLYPGERQQYNEIIKKLSGKKPSQIYGVTHLLRLFVRLGSVLAYSNLSETQASKTIQYIHEFLSYLQENVSFLFSSNDYFLATEIVKK